MKWLNTAIINFFRWYQPNISLEKIFPRFILWQEYSRMIDLQKLNNFHFLMMFQVDGKHWKVQFYSIRSKGLTLYIYPNGLAAIIQLPHTG